MRAKYVIDTNVLISAALTRGVPFQVVEYLVRMNALVFSKETIGELTSRIMRSKCDQYVSTKDREAYINNLILSSDLVIINNLSQGCRDRDDDKFLETALEGGVQAIISGDQDLLMMNPFKNIEILTAQYFLKKVKK